MDGGGTDTLPRKETKRSIEEKGLRAGPYAGWRAGGGRRLRRQAMIQASSTVASTPQIQPSHGSTRAQKARPDTADGLYRRSGSGLAALGPMLT